MEGEASSYTVNVTNYCPALQVRDINKADALWCSVFHNSTLDQQQAKKFMMII